MLAFYHMMVFEGEIEPPRKDETVEEEEYINPLCSEGKPGGVDYEDQPEPEEPPDEEPLYGCKKRDDNLQSSDTYEKICCRPPSHVPESCLHWTGRNKGGQGLSDELKQQYLDADPHTVFIPVTPRGADGCGTIHWQLKVAQKNCCNEIDPLVWNAAYLIGIEQAIWQLIDICFIIIAEANCPFVVWLVFPLFLGNCYGKDMAEPYGVADYPVSAENLR